MFACLKILISTQPVLSHPAHQFTVEVDALDTGDNSVLSQQSSLQNSADLRVSEYLLQSQLLQMLLSHELLVNARLKA